MATKPTAKKTQPKAAKTTKRPAKSAPLKRKAATTSKKQAAKPQPKKLSLSSSLQLLGQVTHVLWGNKKLFLSILAIYGIVDAILAQGFLSSTTNVMDLKSAISSNFGLSIGPVTQGLAIYIKLLGSSGINPSQTNGAYELILMVLASLALIWAYRRLATPGSKRFRARDAYYNGTYPLVPFLVVLFRMGLELIPLALTGALYSLVITNSIVVLVYEKLIFLTILAIGLAISVYLILPSIIALYVVTLPGVTPRQAMLSGRKLIRGHRWLVLRRILVLVLVVIVCEAIVMIPVITLLAGLAPLIFFILTLITIAVVHGYMFSLYRELLDESE